MQTPKPLLKGKQLMGSISRSASCLWAALPRSSCWKKKPFDPCWQGGYIATVNGNLNLLLSNALLLRRAAVGL